MGRKINSIKRQHKERLGEEKYNHQGCLMKIVMYNNSTDIIVEFQDEYKARVHTQYSGFKRGNVKNPYYPSVHGIGITGNKYSTRTKEYEMWTNMIVRCFDKKEKERHPTYKDVICCKDWLLYENFYEWLHKQENFDKWYSNDGWAIDKDILVKNNKVYSPDTCCLVPQKVNTLFVKRRMNRDGLPIGVTVDGSKFKARCQNPIDNNKRDLGNYSTPLKAFETYKQYKEDLIKQIAKIEYDRGNITYLCYDAMMNYKVEITD